MQHLFLAWQACLKYAWDELKIEDLSKYVKVWKKLIVPHFRHTPDYMMVQSILVLAIEGGWKDEVVHDS